MSDPAASAFGTGRKGLLTMTGFADHGASLRDLGL
jgi:hypothetical protein